MTNTRKLNFEQAEVMRFFYRTDVRGYWKPHRLAKKFGVSVPTVHAVLDYTGPYAEDKGKEDKKDEVAEEAEPLNFMTNKRALEIVREKMQLQNVLLATFTRGTPQWGRAYQEWSDLVDAEEILKQKIREQKNARD